MRIFESRSAREARLISEVDAVEQKLVTIKNGEPTSSKELGKLDRKIRKLARQKLKNENYSDRVALAELNLRSISPNYKLRSKLAKKIDHFARSYTDGNGLSILNRHTEEYLFLVKSPHYFSNHIKTLETRWNVNAHLYEEDGTLRFHTSDSVRLVKALAASHPDHILSLEQEAIRDRSERSWLTSSFKVSGDGNYYVALVNDCPRDRIERRGHHAWIRLYDPSGNVYSTGKFPTELTSKDGFKRVEMQVDSSDRHEWLLKTRSDGSSSILESRIQVTEKEFNHVFRSIEKDFQKPSDTFCISGSNCADWALTKLIESGAIEEIDRSELGVHFARLGLPSFANRLIDQMDRRGPRIQTNSGKFVHLGPDYVFGYFLTNMIAIVVGAAKISSTCEGEDCNPIINGVRDLAKPIPVLHPYKLRQVIMDLPTESAGIRHQKLLESTNSEMKPEKSSKSRRSRKAKGKSRRVDNRKRRVPTKK